MDFRRFSWRMLALAGIALAISSAPGIAPAQAPPNLPPPGAYVPIPNYTGVGAGLQFRNAINDRFSGAQPIAPSIASVTFANLPVEQDGALLLCSDCKTTTPCVGGGAGGWALATRGVWSCAGQKLEAALNANGNKVSNLGAATVNGDAIGFGQPGGGDLSGTLPNPTVSTVLGGKSPIYATQISPQLQATSGTIAIRSSSNGANSFQNTCVLNVPAGATSGDVMVAAITTNAPAGNTSANALAGWTLIRSDSISGVSNQTFWRAATNSEPASYTWNLSAQAFCAGGIVDLTGVNTAAPIDVSTGGTSTSGNSVTIPALSPINSNDFVIATFGEAGSFSTFATSRPTQNLITGWGNGFAAGSFTNVGGAIASFNATTNAACNCSLAGSEIALTPAVTQQGSPVLNGGSAALAKVAGSNTLANSSAANAATGMSIDGRYNVVAYGADPTATQCSEAAIQSAYGAACSAAEGGASFEPAVWFPQGKYLLCQPVVASCASTVPIQGLSEKSVQLIAPSNSSFPFFISYPATFAANLGTITAASLATGAGNAVSFPQPSTTTPWYLNLDDYLINSGATSGSECGRPLNGLGQFDVEIYFNWKPIDANASHDYNMVGSGGTDHTNGVPESGLFQLTVRGPNNANGAIRAQLNVNGTLVALAGGSVTANATHEAELSYDGVAVRLFFDGALVASQATTGNTLERIDETAVLGGYGVVFPDDGVTQNGWYGLLDSLRISRVARHTAAFTAPTAKFASDANTLLLLNFDKFAAASNYVIGADSVNGSASVASYAVVRAGTGPTQGASFHLRDLSSLGGQGMAVVMAEPASSVQNLSLSGFQKTGIEFYGSSTSSRADHIVENPTCGLFGISSNALAGGEISDFQENGGYYAINNADLVNRMIWKPASSGVAGFLWKSATATSGATCVDCLIQIEAGGGAIPAKITGTGSIQFIGGDFETNAAANVEAMDINPAFGLQVSLAGTHYEGGAAPELIHYVAQTSNPQATWSDPRVNGNAWSANTVALTDWGGHAQVVGDVTTLNDAENRITNGVRNVLGYGASASTMTRSATTTGSSTTVALNSAGDFIPGQAVVIPHAGASSNATTPTALAVAPNSYALNSGPTAGIQASGCQTDATNAPGHNAGCATTYRYSVSGVSASGGWSAPTSVVQTTVGPTTVSVDNNIEVTWTGAANDAAYVIGRCTGSACTPAFYAVLPHAGSPGASAQEFRDIGHSFGADENLGSTIPVAAVAQDVYTTVASVTDPTHLVLASAPSQSGTFTMHHDDSVAIQSAIDTVCDHAASGGLVAGKVAIPGGRTYPIAQPLNFYGCYGVTLGGAGQPGDGAQPSTIEWHGPVGGIVFNMNKTADSRIENLAVPSIGGSSPGVIVDMDNYTTGGAGDGVPTQNNQLVSDEFGNASIGVRVSNRGGANVQNNMFYNVQISNPSTGRGGWAAYGLFGAGQSYNNEVWGGLVQGYDRGIYSNFTGQVDFYGTNFEFASVVLWFHNRFGGAADGHVLLKGITTEGDSYAVYNDGGGVVSPVIIEESRLSGQPGPNGWYMQVNAPLMIENSFVGAAATQGIYNGGMTISKGTLYSDSAIPFRDGNSTGNGTDSQQFTMEGDFYNGKTGPVIAVGRLDHVARIEACSNAGTVSASTTLSFAKNSCQKISTATTGLTYTLSTTGLVTDQVVTIESNITGAIGAGPLWASSSGAIKWAAGSAPVSSNASGFVDVIRLKWDGANWLEVSRSIGDH